MNPQNKGTSSSSPADPPLKRRRGRPRKDESLTQGENSPPVPGSESVKKSKQSTVTTGAVGVDMLGQVIYGVIDGSFDAGYLVKVKVGDSDTPLRGIVFLPGRFTPITAANDVAPQVKMYKRTEIPIPAPNSIMQVPGSIPSSEQCGKQPAEPKNLAPSVQVQGPQSELTNVPVVQENEPDSKLPLTASLLSSGGTSLGVKVMPLESLDSGPQRQSALIMEHMDRGKAAELGEGLQKFDSSSEKDHNANAKATEQQFAASSDVLFKPEHQTPTAIHDLEPNQLVHEEKQATIIAEPATGSSEPVALNNQMGKQASLVKPSHQELGLKANSGVDEYHSNGKQPSDAADTSEKGSESAPTSDLPITMFESNTIPSEANLAVEGSPFQQLIGTQLSTSPGAANSVKADSDTAAMTSLSGALLEEEAIPSETKLAGPVLPLMAEIHFCGSADAANNIDRNIKDSIPPTES